MVHVATFPLEGSKWNGGVEKMRGSLCAGQKAGNKDQPFVT